MKLNLNWASLVTSTALVLTGCCCVHQATQWEYKVAVTPVGPSGTRPTEPAQREQFLNELAKDGWVLVTTEGDYLYVKRPKR